MSDHTGNTDSPCRWCGDNHGPQWSCDQDGLRREIERLRDLFRRMRATWFAHHLRSWAPECEWEDELRERRRLAVNMELGIRFDEQTEGILAGKEFSLTPACGADMDTDAGWDPC